MKRSTKIEDWTRSRMKNSLQSSELSSIISNLPNFKFSAFQHFYIDLFLLTYWPDCDFNQVVELLKTFYKSILFNLKSFSDNVLIKFNIADPIVGKLNSKCFWKFYRIYIFIIFMYKFVIFCFLYRRNSLMWITLWMKMYKISQNKYPWWYWLLNTRCYVAQTILISCAQIG